MGQIGMDDKPHHQQSSEQHGHHSHSSLQTSHMYDSQNPFIYHGLPYSLPEEFTFPWMPHPSTTLSLLPYAMTTIPNRLNNTPSMSTNPHGDHAPLVSIAPRLASNSAPNSGPTSARVMAQGLSRPDRMPRRVVEDDCKHYICRYYTTCRSSRVTRVTQEEVGDLFDLERSTVSKVLLQKDKYLSQQPKGEPPDVNFGVCNWAQRLKNKAGRIPTDEEIKNHGIKLATMVGIKALRKVKSASWLKNIKQEIRHKYELSDKLPSRAAEANISDTGIFTQGSPGSSVGHTPSRHLPCSPADLRKKTSFFKTSNVGSSFSGGPSTLATPFSLTKQGPFALPQNARLTLPTYPQRRRPETSPSLSVNPATAATAAFPPHSFSLPKPTSSTAATTTPPTSPTQDDARLALETILKYMVIAMQHGLVNEVEYQTVANLTGRMRGLECGMSIGA